MGSEGKKSYIKFLIIFVPMFLIVVDIPLLGKKVRVGYFCKKPIAYSHKSGKATGLAIDIFNDIARKNKWELVYVKGSFSQGVNRLLTGKIDLMVPIGYTRERDKKFDYSSEGILQSWGCLFTKRGGQIRSITDVKGKRIAYVKKSLFHKKFRKIIAGFGVNCTFVEVATYGALIRGVVANSFDGGVGGRLGIIGFNRDVLNKIDASIVFSPFSLYLAVAAGDPLSILPKINNYLISGKDEVNSSYSRYKNRWLSGVVDSESSLPLSFVFFLFVFFFLGYLLSHIPFIRRAVGLVEIVELRVSSNVLFISWFLALFVWLMEALIKYFWFNFSSKSFIAMATTFDDSHGMVMRFFYVVPILLGGIIISRIFARLAKQYRLAQESSENYRITLNSIGDGVVTTDTEGRITQINPVAQQLMGLQEEEAYGELLRDVFNIVNEKTKKVVANPVDKVLSFGTVVGLANHTVLISKDGSEYQIADSAAPIKDGNDKIIGVVLVFRDVTEEYRMEDMMIQSEKMLSVGGLAAGMAHEINNPLSGMMQTASVIATRLEGNTKISANLKAAKEAGIDMVSLGRYMASREIPRMLNTINDAGQRVADIVNNMLSFARKSDNLKFLQNIEEIVEKTLELAATDYDLKNNYDFKLIEIKKDYAKNIPLVACEGAKIQQVLLNLLRNGAQAMEMAKTKTPKFIVGLSYDKKRSRVVIEIADNGPGMDEVTRKRVFEPFFTTKPVGVGTGLGLSVSYFIITEGNGGELAVESELGKGAKFIVKLPVEPS